MKEVMESRKSVSPIKFAMCDPLPLLLSEYDLPCRPVVLASLITNSAIWAIDHDIPETEFHRGIEVLSESNHIRQRQHDTCYCEPDFLEILYNKS